jgi:hypothetical protein
MIFLKYFLFYWAFASIFLAVQAMRHWDFIIKDYTDIIPESFLRFGVFLLISLFGWAIFPYYCLLEIKLYFNIIRIVIKYWLIFLIRKIKARLFLWGIIKVDPNEEDMKAIGRAIIGIIIDTAKLSKNGTSKDSDSVPDNGTGKEV